MRARKSFKYRSTGTVAVIHYDEDYSSWQYLYINAVIHCDRAVDVMSILTYLSTDTVAVIHGEERKSSGQCLHINP